MLDVNYRRASITAAAAAADSAAMLALPQHVHSHQLVTRQLRRAERAP